MTDDSLRYQNRAFELRMIAADCPSPENRRALILCARSYERLALSAEKMGQLHSKEPKT